VTEVAAPFDISLNSVSKHIRILERAGLVRRRVAGRDHFLSLDPAPLDAAAAWMQRERAAWLAAGEFDLRVGGKIELIFDNDKLSDDAPKGGGWATHAKTMQEFEAAL